MDVVPTSSSPLPDAHVGLVLASDARLVRANMPVLVERAVGRAEYTKIVSIEQIISLKTCLKQT